MEVDVRQSLREDRMSDCRSFGCNYHPSSQSRKISIGVTVDSLAKGKPGATKEDEGKQPNTERIEPSIGISTEGKNKGEAVTTSKGKQTEDTEQVKSPWITPRSLHKKSLAAETASFPEETSNPRQKKINAVKDVPVTYSIQFFPNQTLNAQNVGSEWHKVDSLINGLTYQRKGMKDGNSQRLEEFNFANARKVLELDKVVIEDKADKTQNIQTETLKMKLWELLGTVSSPKSLQSSSWSHKVSANNLKPEISADHMGDTVVKPRQNSDTIETDSDNPDKTIKRPVTHSLTRKRAPAKVQPDKTRVGLSSKQKHQQSIFSFGEGKSTKLDGAVNCESSLSRKKKILRKSSKIGPRKLCFPREDNGDEVKQTTYRSETPLPGEKTSILGNKIESLPGSFSEKRRENSEKVQEKDSFHSPVTNKTNQQVNFDNPTSPEKGDKQEDLGNISLRNFLYTQDDFQSPTFGFNTPILNTSPIPTPKTVEMEKGACNPVLSERGFTIGNIRSFRTFQTSRTVCNDSNAQAQSPEDAEKHTVSSLRNAMPAKENFDPVNELSEASPEERRSESFEEGSPIIKRYDCHRDDLLSPETVISEKPNFVHCPIKRLQNLEDFRLSEFSPTSPSQEGAGIGKSYWFQEPSEQDQEDELTRAVTLFALALETFKRKMDSATRKKSSEILMSISEEIKSMLLNVEFQIESDVGKLTSLSKTKRKHLETRLQEQQEQLKLMLEKFKEDIHHHLLDCNSILEGMEAHQIELKGIMKRQKVSHQKLLMHAEEAAEIQLNNAERRITAVHESASEKMLHLKHVIAECLKDSIY
ncbi:meiosis-specific protein ASY3-like isoform X3 [Durio zibethinus]|uniref:Meiosis-specific protein ASY3-like isoform X3 n=1 Tax=Durio zibethinus TaxID=66656 RepID=A0A6P6B0I8_DURZI|nr:meiosis-specific protein ASY3-like isoform X3 [Durio zibethinus]